MLYEVFYRGKCMASTESESCIPDKETIKSILNAGYDVFIKGKQQIINEKGNVVAAPSSSVKGDGRATTNKKK